MIVSLLFITVLLVSTPGSEANCPGGGPVEPVFAFDRLEFDWPNASIESEWGDVKRMPAGIKIFEDDVFISAFREKGSKHPVNIAKLPKASDACVETPTSPLAT